MNNIKKVDTKFIFNTFAASSSFDYTITTTLPSVSRIVVKNVDFVASAESNVIYTITSNLIPGGRTFAYFRENRGNQGSSVDFVHLTNAFVSNNQYTFNIKTGSGSALANITGDLMIVIELWE